MHAEQFQNRHRAKQSQWFRYVFLVDRILRILGCLSNLALRITVNMRQTVNTAKQATAWSVVIPPMILCLEKQIIQKSWIEYRDPQFGLLVKMNSGN